ncbi:DUF551 domain-containing protein [Candidatus Pacearchaeota archaeon]|nr:DUF551 domain-containing protein [Candidatus Pacearchaeota archaeon]
MNTLERFEKWMAGFRKTNAGKRMEAHHDMFDAFKAGRKDAQEWIECKDRLPDSSRLVLIVAERSQPFIGYFKHGHCWMQTGEGGLLQVVRNESMQWQELPAPKEQE